jgi:hypothetical protein
VLDNFSKGQGEADDFLLNFTLVLVRDKKQSKSLSKIGNLILIEERRKGQRRGEASWAGSGVFS